MISRRSGGLKSKGKTVKGKRRLDLVVKHLGAKQVFIRPHCPWQNGKVGRLNRTLQREWAYRQVFTSNWWSCQTARTHCP
jgi:transposase InsO family protein